MQYWNEMSEKYGFGDGGAYPVGIELYRDVYVKTVNKLAEKHGSNVRILPYNRNGIHNNCMWVCVSKEVFEEVAKHYGYRDEKVWEAVEGRLELSSRDKAMYTAIADAFEMTLDDFIVVEPYIAHDFPDFLLNPTEEYNQ